MGLVTVNRPWRDKMNAMETRKASVMRVNIDRILGLLLLLAALLLMRY